MGLRNSNKSRSRLDQRLILATMCGILRPPSRSLHRPSCCSISNLAPNRTRMGGEGGGML
eukprot:2476032-Rhodomonas_salina.2